MDKRKKTIPPPPSIAISLKKLCWGGDLNSILGSMVYIPAVTGTLLSNPICFDMVPCHSRSESWQKIQQCVIGPWEKLYQIPDAILSCQGNFWRVLVLIPCTPLFYCERPLPTIDMSWAFFLSRPNMWTEELHLKERVRRIFLRVEA